MSRVHDALRRAGQLPDSGMTTAAVGAATAPPQADPQVAGKLHGLLASVAEIPFNPAPESHLIDLHRPMETPSEEFRSLRTKLNHMQTLQPLHSVIVTSASPAEGKSFTTMNLALAESHLADNMVLCADFDLRRPTLHNLLQVERTPGISDYLKGEAPLEQCIRKVAGSNLYFLPAGTAVKNPLELLNLREAKQLFEQLPTVFNWIFCDSPPLLFSADANLMATYADGTILVVRIGSTTIDTITRAVQSLCENNVLGIVTNGARAGELYSKYTYYYSRREG
ncbi:MAG: CpsD/CapB family tyrosine-protein kinase [Bryobacteraceae bacterium]